MEMTSDGAIYKSSEEISRAGLRCNHGKMHGPHISHIVYLASKVVTSFLRFKRIV